MSIDEKAFALASMRWPEMMSQPLARSAIESYEAAKDSQQPDEAPLKDFRITYYNHTPTEIVHLPSGRLFTPPVSDREPQQPVETTEDAEFKAKFEALDATNDYVGLREFAGVISQRLRQMDKRAKRANERADLAERMLRQMMDSNALSSAPERESDEDRCHCGKCRADRFNEANRREDEAGQP